MYFTEQIKQDIQYFEKAISTPPLHLLKILKGIGTYSAIVLLIEIGDIKQFPNVKKLVSFLGLHPVYKQSCDSTWAWRMSKQGRKKTPRPDTSRSYHQEDDTAAISYRQTKKRKEREQSQSELVTICEIQIPTPSACN
ncbi:IS110 family transposase [candidate division KSB1 bacterium]|nr:IS110 family transposase [candidate division KSB1 bacterium]